MSKLESTEEHSNLTARGLQSILNFASKIDDKDEITGEATKEVQNKNNSSAEKAEFSENLHEKSNEER